jgi:hypothetical protein
LNWEQKRIKSVASPTLDKAEAPMPHNNINALTERPDVLTKPKLEGGRRFVMSTPFQPAGDQPTAIPN